MIVIIGVVVHISVRIRVIAGVNIIVIITITITNIHYSSLLYLFLIYLLCRLLLGGVSPSECRWCLYVYDVWAVSNYRG